MNDKLYTEGFNAGYILQGQKPNIAAILALIKSDDIFLKGFREGKAEREQEKEQQKLDELQQLRQKDQGKQKERDV